MIRRLALFTCTLLSFTGCPSQAEPRTMCMYTDDSGATIQTNSRDQVPEALRSTATCFTERVRSARSGESPEPVRSLPETAPPKQSVIVPSGQRNELARPDEIELDGTVRREYLASPLGNIDLRWPRKVEALFGRTPSRAMAETARTIARVIAKPAFPPEARRMNANWKVVFMDAELSDTQIPSYLITNCHPGWMTPPANIYIVSQRVAGGCGGERSVPSVADSQLTEVLVHEMGHALESHLLGRSFGADRMRAEGFATWFTEYAADYSSLISKSRTRDLYTKLAREAVHRDPQHFHFQGSAEDYARAAMYFRVIVDQRGLDTLLEIYKTMAKEQLSLFQATQRRVGWSQSQLNDEVRKSLKLR